MTETVQASDAVAPPPPQQSGRVCLQPYLRTSTDDKGQDPERQLDTIRPWVERHRCRLLEAVVDEGTSAWKVDPFERPRFLQAIRQAQNAGAWGIVLETVDRFTRIDAREFVYAQVKLEKEFGLKLLFADIPPFDQDTFEAGILNYIKAQGAHEWIKAHSAKVRSGMRRRIEQGAVFGRPRKLLSAHEMATIVRLHDVDGWGFPSVAQEINRLRGVDRLATKEARAKRSVSDALVRREYKKFKTGEPALDATKVVPRQLLEVVTDA